MNRREQREELVRVMSQLAARLEEPTKELSDGGWLEGVTHRRMTIHTKDDKSYEGLLQVAAPDGVVLWAAKLLGKQELELEGQIWIPRTNIHMIQADWR